MFASHPRAACWNTAANTVLVTSVKSGSETKRIFTCATCAHNFSMSPAKVVRGQWCSYCAGKRMCQDLKNCSICWEKSFASHEKAAFWSHAKNIVPLNTVSRGSETKRIFTCGTCSHDFAMSPAVIGMGCWCPFCSRSRRCPDPETCKLCWDRCFASHPRAVCWNRDKNGMDPSAVSRGNDTLRHFTCDVCHHDFLATPMAVCAGSWCPFCANKRRCESTENCAICRERSFASHSRALQWHPRNNVRPDCVSRNSGQKFFFTCDMCAHVFLMRLANVVRGQWCPFCAGRKLCQNLEKCCYCWSKSFASHERAQSWNFLRNSVDINTVSRGSETKRIFTCGVCSHDFEMSPAVIMMGCWCSCVKYKTEHLVYGWCANHLGAEQVERQAAFEWCKSPTGRLCRFDICIRKIRLIIEIDGKQHFEQVSNWKSPEETRERDTYKAVAALSNGFAILRIPQEAVWHRQDNWKRQTHLFLDRYKAALSPKMIIFEEHLSQYKHLLTDDTLNDMLHVISEM